MVNVKEFESLDKAWGHIWSLVADEYPGTELTLDLTTFSTPELMEFAEGMSQRCCGTYEEVVSVNGVRYMLGCDYGH